MGQALHWELHIHHIQSLRQPCEVDSSVNQFAKDKVLRDGK